MANSEFNAKNWRDLIKPRKVEVDQDRLTNSYGKFVAEPLERGFGTTLGNSLRRVLLSILQGAAITSVKIDGVEHEFTTVPEVAEDVTDIVLNLKEVLTADAHQRAEDPAHRGRGPEGGQGRRHHRRRPRWRFSTPATTSAPWPRAARFASR